MHTLLIYFSHFSIEFFALLEVPAQLRNNLFTSCSGMKHFLSCFSFARVGGGTRAPESLIFTVLNLKSRS